MQQKSNIVTAKNIGDLLQPHKSCLWTEWEFESHESKVKHALSVLQAIHMSQKALTDDEASEGDVLCAPKLLEVILQNCRGRVDQCVPLFINLALSRSSLTALTPQALTKISAVHKTSSCIL